MKIHLISDIHTEMDKKLVLTAPPEADLIVLAGDIANGTDGVAWAQQSYGTDIPVVYICGNHEFYSNEISVTTDISKCAAGTNIHFLDNQSKVIDGVRFIGTTLWTSFNDWSNQSIINYLHQQMNDYNFIKATDFYANSTLVEQARSIQKDSLESAGAKKGLLVPIITYMKHLEAVQYLEAELSNPFNGKTIVVTHHAPSYSSVNPAKLKYEDAYASSLEHLITRQSDSIDAWFHGHLHVPVNYKISGVPIISNPRDYPFFAWDPGVKEFIYEI